ncbi:phosphotransferase [Nocardioides flavescens]|uniref:phosphotransferase n=1 Tax=Nocardioides flavescens TaxID=2691959 RepID=UPI001926124A
MSGAQLHEGQVDADAALVRRLVDAQLPAWSSLPLTPVAAYGTDHRLFRLGDELLVRVPVYAGSAGQALTDAAWLPRIAAGLAGVVPVEVPVPVALGEPTDELPFAWSVVPWLEGEPLDAAGVAGRVDRRQLAEDLAAFVLALRAVDPSGGPAPRGPWSRGAPLPDDAASTREVADEIDALAGTVDPVRARRVWAEALEAGPWTGEPVWIHGDLLDGNLLVRDGRLSAVIDFGFLAVADPAPDVVPAWTLFDAEARRAYRAALDVDDATWARARAWAMLPALAGAEYYATSAPAFAARSRRHLDALLHNA